MKRLEEMSDEELALSYADGNNKAFDLLVSRNQAKLFAYILFVVHDEDMANDIFQETFVKVIVRLRERKYVNNGKFSAWVMRIAHNIIMDIYREKKSQNMVDIPAENASATGDESNLMDGNIENVFVNEQVLADIKRMMNLLPAPQREVVFMRFYQEMSFKEIAETTNVSINTSLGRMRYAILNLRKMAKANNLTLQLD